VGESTLAEERPVFTLGTSTRSSEEFITLLRDHGVGVVIDVRRFPSSRFEHFNQEKLTKILNEAGLDYVYMGKELGGYRQEGYRTFTTSTEFQAGVERLRQVAREKRAAIICAERFPWRCHRRFISQELEKQGAQIIHIIDPGRDWHPKKLDSDTPQTT